jgi:hypothetical protein
MPALDFYDDKLFAEKYGQFVINRQNLSLIVFDANE